MSPNGWDNGKIDIFANDPRTQSQAIDLTGGGVLVLFTQDAHAHAHTHTNTIAKQADALLRWLGTPKGFTVYLWWRDDPRLIGAKEWPSRNSVNGGWATVGKPAVHIYRQEEWERVLIHETIHAMNWDWTMPSKPLPCWGLKSTDTVSPYLAEAWTELYAEWLWCGWMNQSWDAQRTWQDHQAAQILARAKHAWEEETNIFAYYVLKAALAPHVEFLWFFGNGKTAEERQHILCTMVQPTLANLRKTAKHTAPVAMSMRMTHVA